MATQKPKRRYFLLCVVCIGMGLGAGFGCSLPGSCSKSEDCPEGSHCFKNKICVWGKASPDNPNLTVPDVRFRTQLNPHDKTAKSSFNIQVDVYGAPKGVDIWLETPHEKQTLECAERVEAKGERRHLDCVPKVQAEGSYALAAQASNAYASTLERFAWRFEKRPLHVQMLLEEKSQHGLFRDGLLYVQLQADVSDIDLSSIELFAGDTGYRQRASRKACQLDFGFPLLSNAVCFEVSLSEFPDLPHGAYGLALTAQLVDKEGNHAAKNEKPVIQISRRLWTSEMKTHSPGVVTREGLLLFVTREWDGMEVEDFLVAINAKGERKWREQIPFFMGSLMLAPSRHSGSDVVISSCDASGGTGFFVATTSGYASKRTCKVPRMSDYEFALLQSGPVVMRRIALDFPPQTFALEACRVDAWNDGFSCELSGPLPTAGTYDRGKMLVRQTREGAARVIVSSEERHWCVMEWKDKGENVNGWTPGTPGNLGCVESGPPVVEFADRIELELLSTEHFWVSSLNRATGYWLQRFDQNAVLKSALNLYNSHVSLLLADTNDALIVSAKDNKLQRLSASGELLYSRDNMRAFDIGLGMVEGGDLIYPGRNVGISCLKSDLKDCWPGANPEDTEIGWLLGILPMSSTRSVAVFAAGEINPNLGGPVSGFLIDSPGLKKDAPWPMYGHDLCRTNNASVPIDNCWDGPRP